MTQPANTSRAIPSRPYLKPWYRIAEDGDRLVFEYAHSVVVFEGKAARKLLPALLPLLDGSRTSAELGAAFGEPARPAIDNAIAILAAKGLLTDGPSLDDAIPTCARDTAALLAATSHGEHRPAAVHERLQSARVGVAGNAAYAEEAARLLRRCGVAHVERVEWTAQQASDVDLVVTLPSTGDVPLVARWNRSMLAAKTPWLQVLPYDGCFTAVGPLYLPGETCCYECYRLRRASTLGYRPEFWALERVEPPFPSAPPLDSAAAGLAAVLAVRWLALSDALVPGRMYAFELGPTFALTVHHVYRVPRCPECSGLDGVAAPLPWFKESEAVHR